MSDTQSTGSSMPDMPSDTLNTVGACAERLQEVQKSFALLAQMILEKVVVKELARKALDETRNLADWAAAMEKFPEKAAEEPTTTLKSFYKNSHEGQVALVDSIEKLHEQFDAMVLKYEEYMATFELFRRQSEAALGEETLRALVVVRAARGKAEQQAQAAKK